VAEARANIRIKSTALTTWALHNISELPMPKKEHPKYIQFNVK